MSRAKPLLKQLIWVLVNTLQAGFYCKMKRLINKATVAHEFQKFTTKKATQLVANKLQNATLIKPNAASTPKRGRVGDADADAVAVVASVVEAMPKKARPSL